VDLKLALELLGCEVAVAAVVFVVVTAVGAAVGVFTIGRPKKSFWTTSASALAFNSAARSCLATEGGSKVATLVAEETGALAVSCENLAN